MRLQTLTIPWNLFLISAGSAVFAIDQVGFVIPVHDPMLAAIAGGVLIGTDAFVIIERTFNVLGKGFSHRKVY